MKDNKQNKNITDRLARPSIFRIFILFFKIGSLGFGGGPAVLSIIQQEVVEKNRWIPEQKYLQGLAIALMPPGSIMVNAAFFVGAHIRGTIGGVAALVGILLPSFLLMIVLGIILVSFKSLDLETSAIKGLAPAVVGVLTAMVLRMSREHIRRWWGIIFMGGSTLLMFYCKVPPYVLILIAIAIPVILWFTNVYREPGREATEIGKNEITNKSSRAEKVSENTTQTDEERWQE